MNLCSEYHEEVCYASHRCPVCKMRQTMEKAVQFMKEAKQRDIDNLAKEIEEIRDEAREA